MAISRREFLKLSLASTSLLAYGGISQLSFADNSTNKQLLVVVFLRGGCDALNLVAPVNDKNYIEARSSDLRILDSGDRAGLILPNNLSRDLDFRLHHEAKPLQDLYNAGKLSIVHATGLTNGTRSHFEAQDLIERGVASLEQVSHVSTGWLARYIQTQSIQGPIPTISATSGVSASLSGESRALAIPDLSNGGLQIPGGVQASSLLHQLYSQDNTTIHLAGQTALDSFAIVDSKLPKQPDGKYAPYQAENNASYDGGGELSRGLQTVARIMKMDIGLSVACIDHGGWDTHEGQPGRFNNQTGQLARNLAAFYQDIARYENNLTVVVMSEFGRRLRSNRSQGTDHGHGGMMMVLGGKVRGGKLLGQWPGLETEQLDRGVDLSVTTDYRSVMSEVLNLNNSNLRAVFPEFELSKANLGIRLS